MNQFIYEDGNHWTCDQDLISEDKKIITCFENEAKIINYSSLSEFIQSPLVQDELLKIDFINNIDTIRNAIKKMENKEFVLRNFVEGNLGNALMDKVIDNSSIPDDNHEATITGYYDVENININLDEISYYGDGILGFEFIANIRVTIDYCIDKHEYYCIAEYEHAPSVSDWNDHYYYAEAQRSPHFSRPTIQPRWGLCFRR